MSIFRMTPTVEQQLVAKRLLQICVTPRKENGTYTESKYSDESAYDHMWKTGMPYSCQAFLSRRIHEALGDSIPKKTRSGNATSSEAVAPPPLVEPVRLCKAIEMERHIRREHVVDRPAGLTGPTPAHVVVPPAETSATSGLSWSTTKSLKRPLALTHAGTPLSAPKRNCEDAEMQAKDVEPPRKRVPFRKCAEARSTSPERVIDLTEEEPQPPEDYDDIEDPDLEGYDGAPGYAREDI
jgi:hypothetical protein